MTLGGLGRGLSAIIPKKNSSQKESNLTKDIVLESSENKLKNIPVYKILPNPHQPRHDMDKDKLESLANSIKEYGILQPLVIQKIAGDQYELIAGHRRLAAAKLAGLVSVPAILRPAEKSKKLEIALIENVQRQNLNHIEEAETFKKLIEEFFLDIEDIAKKAGKSNRFVQLSLKFLNLPDEIKQGLEKGKIGRSHAVIFLSIKENKAQVNLYQKTIAQAWSARELERNIKEHQQKNEKYLSRIITRARASREPKEKSLEFLEAEEIIESILGTKVCVDQKGEIGKIVIEFYSKEDLEELVEKVKKI